MTTAVEKAQENGVVHKIENKMTMELNVYQNASMLKITDEEQKKLLASFEKQEIEIRPDGIIYLPQTFWRKRLNETFGIGQWALIPKSSTKDPDRAKLYLEGVLMVRGNYIATAVGEAEYHEDNTMQSWASVYESAKSDCITRCCKDLSIASELWQPEFIRNWIGENAVKVFVEKKDGKKGVAWRKKTSEPFWNEKGLVPTEARTENKSEHTTAEKTNGQVTPNRKEEDTRPWLSEEQYNKVLYRINHGELDVLEKTKASFRMKKAYREELEKAHEFSSKVNRDLPSDEFPVLVKNELDLNSDSLAALNAVYNEHKELHSNAKFNEYYNSLKALLLTPVKK